MLRGGRQIVAALDDQSLRRLIVAAHSLGLAALVEIHDREELTRALQAGAVTIGVNSRNLRTLRVDLAVFDELILGIPNEAVAVAESGLRSVEDLRQLRTAGYDGFLIGERFMVEPNPGEAAATPDPRAGRTPRRARRRRHAPHHRGRDRSLAGRSRAAPCPAARRAGPGFVSSGVATRA